VGVKKPKIPRDLFLQARLTKWEACKVAKGVLVALQKLQMRGSADKLFYVDGFVR